MSWFNYGTPKKRSLRKGVWLRVRNLPESLLKTAKTLMRINEEIQWIIVSEICPNNQVYLEFWCKETMPLDQGTEAIKRFMEEREKNTLLHNRYNVFGFVVDEDPEWICEGNCGRGFKE